MRILLLVIGAIASLVSGVALMLYLWFAAAQNSAFSRSVEVDRAGYAWSAELMYYAGWGSLIVGAGVGIFLLCRARKFESD